MSLFFLFIFFLFLDDLLLPALLGPGSFMATKIFILSVIAYSKNWKNLALWALSLVLIKEFISGSGTGTLLLPFLMTSIFYLLLNKFLNIRDNLLENSSFSGLLISTFTLVLFNFVYSWFFIFSYAGSYNIGLTWNYWTDFLISSLLSTIGWSVSISILFKYVLKTK